uniref:Ribosomal RNA-processing protein 43 n=1 Tax=Chrysotila carterae TaxID=13221 RepID=A0A7S4FC87_CHRCT
MQTMSDQAAAFRAVHPLAFTQHFLAEGVRPDGRRTLKSRRVHASASNLSSANGSALVRLGHTLVVAAVQAEPVTPAESEPARGRAVVTLEIAATSSVGGAAAIKGSGAAGRLEREQAATLELLQRTVSNNLVDLDSICIESGRAVWLLHCDVCVVEHDGNVLDAAMLAMTCAMQDVRLPSVQLEERDGLAPRLVVQQEEAIALPPPRPLFSLSFGVIGGHLVADPSAEEEVLCTTTFSVLFFEDGAFAGLHKPGGAPLPKPLADSAISAAKEKLPALVGVCLACQRTAAHESLQR